MSIFPYMFNDPFTDGTVVTLQSVVNRRAKTKDKPSFDGMDHSICGQRFALL